MFIMASTTRARADGILVSAAASLTDSMNEIGREFTKAYPRTTVRFNFGSSGALLQQIKQGAPADVFAPASSREMDELDRANLIERQTKTGFAGNRLVLVAPLHSKINRWEDLRLSTVRRVALSNPGYVPSGRYARETLTRRGLWQDITRKAVYGENVRQTLAYVVNGDADAGAVFLTDAILEKSQLRIIERAVSGKDHAAIVYPAAVIRGAPNAPAARRFVAFLIGPEAQGILQRYGFTKTPSSRIGPAPARPKR
jgi:molybdate transport system substrate-binding protein